MIIKWKNLFQHFGNPPQRHKHSSCFILLLNSITFTLRLPGLRLHSSKDTPAHRHHLNTAPFSLHIVINGTHAIRVAFALCSGYPFRFQFQFHFRWLQRINNLALHFRVRQRVHCRNNSFRSYVPLTTIGKHYRIYKPLTNDRLVAWIIVTPANYSHHSVFLEFWYPVSLFFYFMLCFHFQFKANKALLNWYTQKHVFF